MTKYAIVTDLNRCTGCLACSTACKTINGVQPGDFWIKTLRIGPFPITGGSGEWPDVTMYFIPIQCQHCEHPKCVEVCPTQASHVAADGTVQIDKSKCIGCQFCAMACPYGVRYLNEEERVVEKCTLCEQRTAQGELPQCVTQCGGMARWYGDLDEGIESFKGPRGETLGDFVEEFSEDDLYRLDDEGNAPQGVYILRRMAWQGGDVSMQ